MNPATGTFTSMDTYGDTVFDPVSLHKYLYANANPVSYTDPSGYFGFADVVISNSIMANLAFYSISGGLIGAGLNLLRQLKYAEKTGEKVDWGEVIFAGIEGALLGPFFGFCGMLAASLSSALIFIALGCTSLTFALLSLVQAGADWQNGDYDLLFFNLVFAGLGFAGAKSSFNAASTCSSASETAGTSTNTSPENTNTAESASPYLDKTTKAQKATDTLSDFDLRGYHPKPGERTLNGYVEQNVSTDAEIILRTNSPGFNNNPKGVGGQFKRIGADEHATLSPHVHQPKRNPVVDDIVYGTTGSKTNNGGVTYPTRRDVVQLYEYLENGKYH